MRSTTFHVQPYDPEVFDVEAHRRIAADRLGVAAANLEAVTGPVIVPRRGGAADITYSRAE